MKGPLTEHEREFNVLTRDLSTAVREMSDPVAIGTMLYAIAEEKKSSNLIIRDLNGKFDAMLQKLGEVSNQLEAINKKIQLEEERAEIMDDVLSERDNQIIESIKNRGKACAKEIQDEFGYKGRNAASARLNLLYQKHLLKKIYIGREVYYTITK